MPVLQAVVRVCDWQFEFLMDAFGDIACLACLLQDGGDLTNLK